MSELKPHVLLWFAIIVTTLWNAYARHLLDERITALGG